MELDEEELELGGADEVLPEEVLPEEVLPDEVLESVAAGAVAGVPESQAAVAVSTETARPTRRRRVWRTG